MDGSDVWISVCQHGWVFILGDGAHCITITINILLLLSIIMHEHDTLWDVMTSECSMFIVAEGAVPFVLSENSRYLCGYWPLLHLQLLQLWHDSYLQILSSVCSLQSAVMFNFEVKISVQSEVKISVQSVNYWNVKWVLDFDQGLDKMWIHLHTQYYTILWVHCILGVWLQEYDSW